MKIRRFAVAACAACTILALGACNSDQKKTETKAEGSMAVKADNTVCPFSGEAVNPSVAPAAYKGKHVGFCCPNCKGKFEKMSDAEKDAKVASMK
jgi:hypothetical protein